MDNRPPYSEESQFNTHPTNHYPPRNPSNLSSSNQMVHPTQRDYQPSGYPQQNPNLGHPGSNMHPSHLSSSQGQYYSQSIPQSTHGHQMSGHMTQAPQGMSSHHAPPRYPPQNSMQQHYQSYSPSPYMQGPPPSNYGSHHGYQPPSYYTDDYNPTTYPSYPSAHGGGPPSSGGYPSRRTLSPNAATYSAPPPNDLSPQHAPQHTPTQPLPPALPTATSSTKPDNISEFKKKAEQMKELFLPHLDDMINKVTSIQKDKDKKNQGHKNFEEIQKKLTLLKTLITADFKPNSNFPPRKEILEAAEKQIKMWIEEWGKLSTQLDGSQPCGVDASGVPTQPSTQDSGSGESSETKKEQPDYALMQDLGSSANWPLSDSHWPAELENLALSLPLDDNYGGTFFNEGPPPQPQPHSQPVSVQPPPMRNLNDMPNNGIIPEAILGKRQAGDESLYPIEEQPPPKFPKTS